jgi:hypothetical protein
MKRRAAIYLATPEADRRPDHPWALVRQESFRQQKGCYRALSSLDAEFGGLFSDPIDSPVGGRRHRGSGLVRLLHALDIPEDPYGKMDLVLADEVLEGSADLDQIAATGVEVLLIGSEAPETSGEL